MTAQPPATTLPDATLRSRRALEEQLELATQALRFYADSGSWSLYLDGETLLEGSSDAEYDRGKKARQALKELRGR